MFPLFFLALLAPFLFVLLAHFFLICNPITYVFAMKRFILLFAVLIHLSAFAQHSSSLNAAQWVDSVFKTLSEDQKIAQLMVVRLSTGNAAKTEVVFHDKEVEEAIRKYNIGGICLFQGG